MKLAVVAVGARMPGWVDTAFEDYARRMPRKARLALAQIRPEPRSSGKTRAQLMAAEARRMETAIAPGSVRVALDESGRDLTSAAFATLLGTWLAAGASVAFLIGGADGLDAALKASASLRLRLSSLTLPHALVRVILAEQLYRAISILDNHPYHRS